MFGRCATLGRPQPQLAGTILEILKMHQTPSDLIIRLRCEEYSCLFREASAKAMLHPVNLVRYLLRQGACLTVARQGFAAS